MKPLVSFADANRYLSGFYKNHRANYSLDTMLRLMAHLGNPQDQLKVVHVAGTSGKTSTAYYAAALLTAAGQKTGLTVSPHVDEVNERVQINGQPLNEAEFCHTLTDFSNLIERTDLKPSWFEVMVAFAYWYFARERVDYAVIETGLGGLKDGTNVISRPDKVCLLTDIGLDHTEVLGKTVAEIAAQKAGIIQPNNTVFTYEQSLTVMEVYEETCRQQQAALQVVKEGDNGDYRRRNWQLAHAAYEYLAKRDELPALSDQRLDETRQITVPGRMDAQTVQGKTVVMDGAHNAQKLAAFLASFQKQYPGVKPAVLLGLKRGKEYRELAPLLAPLAARVIVTTFQATQDTKIRSMDPAAINQAMLTAGLDSRVIADQAAAVQALLAGDEPVVIITGSFYLLGQIRNNGLLP